MDENKVLELYDKGHSIDYIIGFIYADVCTTEKYFDRNTRELKIKPSGLTRQDVSSFVYKVIYNRHLERIKKGEFYVR